MSLRRSSSPSGRRALVAAGLTAAIVAVPVGTASAADDPLARVTGFLEELAATGSAPPAVIGSAPPAVTGSAPPAVVPGLPAFEVPPEVRAAFQQLADVAMLPENCVDGVADAIDLILGGLVALPLELADVLADLLALLGGGGLPLPAELDVLQDLLDQLLGGLTGALPEEREADAPATPGVPGLPTPTLVSGLLALGAALQECIPAPPVGDGAVTPTTPPAAAPPTQAPIVTAPTTHTPAPVAAPVAYLGYAPTGADAARAVDASVPLTALAGGLVLLAGAGAAGYGMRGRAVRARD